VQRVGVGRHPFLHRAALRAQAARDADSGEGRLAVRGDGISLSDAERAWFRDQLVPAWVTPEVKARVTARLEQR